MTARDIVRLLANQPGVWALTFQRYTPQSGAARRAIAAGADPAPLLLDVSEYGETVTASASKVSAFLDQPGLGADQVLALNSSMLRSGGVGAELLHMLAHCGWAGWLLVSGASYHFLGREPMSLPKWRRAMARALLIPGIDYRCTGHALYGERGAVRLTTCPAKPTEPYVVGVLPGGR